jgi:hypothetical protein
MEISDAAEVRIRGANFNLVSGNGLEISNGASVQLTDVALDAADTGVLIEDGSSVTIERLSVRDAITAGVSVKSSASATIDGSSIQGNLKSVDRMSGGTVSLGNTKLDGPVAGGLTCVGVYDANYQPLNSSCQ